MASPLDGIRLLELSAGPPVEWATGIIGDFGAEVIKVQRLPETKMWLTPSGIITDYSDEEEAKKAAYDSYNRNKKSIALNLKSKKGIEIFYKMVSKSDIVLEGFRPGVMKRLNADYDTLKEINPKIIYCSATGYGQTPPFKNLVGHDLNYISIAGILDLTGKSDGPPVMPGTQVADWGGASQVVIGILLALIARHNTGKGQYIDISMTDSTISWQRYLANEYFQCGIVPRRSEKVNTGGVPYNNIYQTKDGKYISIACWEPRFFENLCRTLGREDLIPYQNAGGNKRKEIFAYFNEVFLTKTRDEWFEFLKDKDICIAPVYSFDEVFSCDYVAKRNMVQELDHPTLGKIKQIGVPIKLSDTPGQWRNFAPLYGQDTDKILQDLGYTQEEIKSLRNEGIVS